ncbi:MAG: DUF4340 domain-containing protein [Nitrospinota bacterium]|nr:DUF4340 domain-containing protein [Nitrospinota bacterium]MDH5756800.1 DUF4340 domain-containing protein [Nitrospinota bacterium]
MRYYKTTFIWLMILTAVAGYSYIDWEKTVSEEKRKEEESRLFKFDPPQVAAIVLEKEGSLIEIERWEDGWRITRPLMAKADSEAVEKFLGHVTKSKNDSDYVMDPAPSPERLLEFGLATPAVTLTMKVGKDLETHTILFGKRGPTMGIAFARLKGQEPVYRVLADARSEADKDVYYFRDKRILRFNPVMVDQLAMSRDEMDIRLKLPENGRWVIEKPIKARADHNRVFEVMGMFFNSEVKEFVDETRANMKSYGLDKPSAKLSFWQSGDSDVTVSISIGDRNPEKRGYYVSMSDRENIFLVEEDLVNSIPRDAADLRSRNVFYMEAEQLTKIEIHQRGKIQTLVRDQEKEWHMGSLEGEKVDYNQVKEFFDALASIRVRDFVTDNPKSLLEYGLYPPFAQILLYEDSSTEPMYLSLGGKTPAGYIYAQSGAEKSILAVDEGVKGILNIFM